MMPNLYRSAVRIMAAVVAVLAATPAQADYDLGQGVPKFVNSIYIDMRKITRLSKFRSFVGHEYSDSSQFGTGGLRGAGNRIEQCRSMKHYFIAPDNTVNVYAPVTGTVTNVTEEFIGQQIEIRSDQYPDFRFIMFHVGLAPRLNIGDHVTEGQLIGTHGGSATWSDIAVWVQTPGGKHFVSYFETLTDQAFAAIQARGVVSRDQLIISAAQRDADGCRGFSNPAPSEFVDLTGGAVRQTISTQTPLPVAINVGDAPHALTATSSAGLTVTVTSHTPKVCAVAGDVVTARRPGICQLTLTQAGNADTFAATPFSINTTVLPQGVVTSERPRLAAIYAPSPTGPQSFLRFYNSAGVAGTVTASLFNAANGALYAKWTSPVIPGNASVQYDIATLEAAATPGTLRPSAYTLTIDAETTLIGYMQHVVFDPAAEALLNYSSCGAAVNAPLNRAMNVHSSRLSASYPSTLSYNHITSSTGAMSLDIADAAGGARVGFYLPASIALNAVQTVGIDTVESQIQALNSNVKAQYTPTAAQFHYNINDSALLSNSTTRRDFYQHLVTNKKPGLISDMTAMCVLNGFSQATIPATLRSAPVSPATVSPMQSFLRFYNSGTTAGPVAVVLYDAKTGAALNQWISPTILPGSEHQYDVASIQSALGLSGYDSYGVAAHTNIDGLYQHIVWHGPGGALSNLSTCSEAVSADPRTLVGVHSGVMAAAGYPSKIIVHNTGTVATTARLTILDARDGSVAGTYTTAAIAANGALTLDVSTIEAATQITPGGTMFHYVIKADDAFTGQLQHLVRNNAANVTTDLTNVCLM
jgi:hypothetical protein